MSVTGGIIAGVGLAGSLGGAAVESNAAGNAASTQAGAADTAAQLQYQESQNALNFQENEWNTQQQNLAPWLNAGKGALGELTSLTSTPGQGLLTPWTTQFTAPTAAEAAQYPGYQFQLGQGEQALQNSAAASGSLESGNTQEALNNYAQNYAQNDYTNVYNQAMQQYQQQYGIFENNQTNAYNRLAGIAGTGQTAATSLGTEGQQAASTVGNIDLTTGAQQGQDLQNAAAAEASGYIGSANAYGGALSSGTNNLTQLALLSQLYGGNGGGGGIPSPIGTLYNS
jgi:hypothetical protein